MPTAWSRENVVERALNTLDWFGYYYGGNAMYGVQYVSLVNGVPTLGSGTLIAADCSAFASWCWNRSSRISSQGFKDIYPTVAKVADTVGKNPVLKQQIMEAPVVEPEPVVRKNFWDNGGFSMLLWILFSVLMMVMIFRMFNRGPMGGGAGVCAKVAPARARMRNRAICVFMVFIP